MSNISIKMQFIVTDKTNIPEFIEKVTSSVKSAPSRVLSIRGVSHGYKEEEYVSRLNK
jgi:hypothetical protein